jgi:AcrR family transcriptional regulator
VAPTSSPAYDRPMARAPVQQAGPPRWQRRDHAERRSQILDCARRLFTDRGYGEVSMGDIATCAGVRRGLLHHYFGDKRALYLEVVRELLRRFSGLLDESGGSAAAGGEDTVPPCLELQVADRVDRWLDVVEQQGDSWFTIILAGAAAPDAELRSIVGRARAAMVEGIVATLTPPGATARARVVLRAYGGLADVVTREWLQRGAIDRAQAHALLSTSLLAMVTEVLPAVEAATDPAGGARPPAERQEVGR